MIKNGYEVSLLFSLLQTRNRSLSPLMGKCLCCGYLTLWQPLYRPIIPKGFPYNFLRLVILLQKSAASSFFSFRIQHLHFVDLFLYQFLDKLVMKIPACFILDVEHFSC